MKSETEQVYKVTKRNFRTRKGVEIAEGTRVELTFDVKYKDGIRDGGFHPGYVRMRASDGRSIVTHDFKGAGLRVPGMKQLEHWSWDSIAESVFGTEVEPDGWSYDGSPSWLLALGLI